MQPGIINFYFSAPRLDLRVINIEIEALKQMAGEHERKVREQWNERQKKKLHLRLREGEERDRKKKERKRQGIKIDKGSRERREDAPGD